MFKQLNLEKGLDIAMPTYNGDLEDEVRLGDRHGKAGMQHHDPWPRPQLWLPKPPQAQWGPAEWLDVPPSSKLNLASSGQATSLINEPNHGFWRGPSRGCPDGPDAVRQTGSGQSIYGLEAIVDFTPHVVRLTCSNGAAKSVAKKRDGWDWA